MSNGKGYNEKVKDNAASMKMKKFKMNVTPVQITYLIQNVSDEELNKLNTLYRELDWYIDEVNSEELGNRVIAVGKLNDYNILRQALRK